MHPHRVDVLSLAVRPVFSFSVHSSSFMFPSGSHFSPSFMSNRQMLWGWCENQFLPPLLPWPSLLTPYVTGLLPYCICWEDPGFCFSSRCTYLVYTLVIIGFWRTPSVLLGGEVFIVVPVVPHAHALFPFPVLIPLCYLTCFSCSDLLATLLPGWPATPRAFPLPIFILIPARYFSFF